VTDFEGDEAGSERADAQALDERLPPEHLTPLSVENEIAEAACRLMGIEPEPEPFEADGAAATQADVTRTEAAQADATPEQSVSEALEAPKVDAGEADGPASDAGVNQPPDSQHDPPSG